MKNQRTMKPEILISGWNWNTISHLTRLHRILDFTRTAYQFNKYRDPTGATTAWDSPDVFAKEPLKLHWHQLAGVQSVIRNTFTKEPNAEDKCSGILICDEVGLGKTALAIATIAFLNQSIYCAENGSAQPPVLGVYKYLNGGSIQPYPHLIIAPGTIRKQWLHELKTFFVYKSVDLLVYDSAKEGNSDFWSPTGPFCSSQQRLENRIILTTHSSLVSDFQRVYHSRVVGKKSPWTLPQKHSPTDGTVFHQRFLTVTIDEAHGMRNIGLKYHAALRILQQASVKLVMTGTPLLTSVKDITSMGRLCGVPHFLTQESVDEEKEDAAAGRRAKKLDDDGLSLRRIQIEAVRRMQMQFCGSILRRTVDSKTPTGQKLVDLPPHKDIIGILRLTQRETEIVAERAEAAKATITSANESGKFRTSKFYLEYRSAVSFAKKDPTSLTPTFNSLDEWEPVKSTKMDACARICHHYLSPGHAQGPSTTNRKILIYSEFPSMTKLLRNILTLHGIDTLSIDGKMSYEKRADIVIKFCSLESPRVFVFSTKQTVKVIHLLAEDSADILMNNMARGKKEMFEAFVNKQLGEELRNLLSGKPTYADEDILQQPPEASESEAPVPKKRRRVAKRKPKESASKLEDPPEEGLAEGGRQAASAHRPVGGKHETGKDVISLPPPTAQDEMEVDAHDQKDKTREDVISPPPPTARGEIEVDAHDQKDKTGEDVIPPPPPTAWGEMEVDAHNQKDKTGEDVISPPPPIAQDEMDVRAQNQDTEVEKNTKQPLEIMQGNRSHIPEDNLNPTSGEEDFAGARSNTPSDFPPKPAESADPTGPSGFNLGLPQSDPTDPSDFYPGSPQSDPTDLSDFHLGPPQSEPVDPADSEPDGSFVNESAQASPFKKTCTLDPSKRFSNPQPTGANNPFRICTETQPTTSTNAMAGSSCMPNSQAATKARPAMSTNAVAGPSRIQNNQPDYSRPSPPISQGETRLSAYRQAKSIDQQTRPALSVELFSKYPRLLKNAKGKGKA
ncbi:SNF2 family N-terminal domain-containing protein [Infundibulicybe gibba]|nr:SNF2 family N-terminal domain-containing protein [Infundibulicybe gibba]